MKKTAAIFLLFYSLPVLAVLQDYSFKQITIKDGLSQSTVFVSMQDSRGYMWFGTIDGLNRYDGYEFKIFTNDPDDSTSISDNVITSIFEDSKKQLWIGTVNGFINKFNPETETFTRYFVPDYFETELEPPADYYEYPLIFSRNSNISVTSIAEDQQGFIWIGTWGNGVLRFDQKKNKAVHIYHTYSDTNSLSYNRVSDLLIDRDGVLWISTFGGGLNSTDANGISRDAKPVFKIYKHDSKNNSSLSDNRIITLFADRNKTLWIGTYSGGLNRLGYNQRDVQPAAALFKRFKTNEPNTNCLCNNTVMDIAQDNKGYLWIGTFGGGLDRLDTRTESFFHFSHDNMVPQSLPDNDILSLSVDRSGIIWVGSHLGEGVTKVIENKAKFNLMKNIPGDPYSLNDDVVWSIYKDNDKLWIGTYRGGLNVYNYRTGKFKSYQSEPGNKNSLNNNHIRVIREDRFGNLWIGTYNGGINKFNPRTGRFTHYLNEPDNPNSLSANQVQDILIESDSVIWAATFGGGLNKLSFAVNSNVSQPSITVYEHDPADSTSLSDNRIYDLFIDSDGTLWIATFGGGLNKFNSSNKTFTHYFYNKQNPYSISNNKVLVIYEGSNGYLWIGTSGGGLNRFDKKTGKFKRYSQRNGLTSATIYGIFEDHSNNLWMSSDNGVFKHDLSSGRFTHFGIEDGLQSLEFNGGSYFQDENGQIFFGGINGLNYFYPDSIRTSTYVPPIVISSISVLNKELKGERQELRLSFNENLISFTFASLDFSNPSDILYAFMMEGLEDNWKYVDANNRVANYINLPPGEYTFRVTGTNADGLWNRSGVSVKLIITPPFWQTWWFVTLAIILIGSLLYYISTVGIKHQLAIEKLKTKLAADLHDNVGAGLTEISILSEVAAHKTNGGSNSKELETISETARQLVDTMSDIVWVVNPERDSLYDLIIKLKDSYNDFLNSVGISFRVKNIDKTNDIKLPMDYKQNLLLIFKEGINNAIKHSNCKKIILEANIRGDVIEMTLIDDGKGFDEKEIEAGNGMKNMEARAKKIGGKFRYKSEPDKGTTIHFIGKLSKFYKLKSFLNK